MGLRICDLRFYLRVLKKACRNQKILLDGKVVDLVQISLIVCPQSWASVDLRSFSGRNLCGFSEERRRYSRNFVLRD